MRNVLVHRYPIIDYDQVWAGLDRFAELSVWLEDRMALRPADDVIDVHRRHRDRLEAGRGSSDIGRAGARRDANADHGLGDGGTGRET
jgi:hypothetical protein